MSAGGPSTLVQYLGHQEDMGQLTATDAGCDLCMPGIDGNYTLQLECLRSVTASNLTQASINAGGEVTGLDHMTTPIVDGYIHPVPPQSAFWSGKWNHANFLGGSNYFETYVFEQAYIQNTPGTIPPDYSDSALILQNFTDAYTCANGGCPAVDQSAIAALAEMYGPNGPFNAFGPALGSYYALDSASSEGIIQCGMRRIAEYAYNANKASYLYAFGLRGNGIGYGFGPVHSFELQWVC